MRGIRKIALLLTFVLCIIFSVNLRAENVLAKSTENVLYDESTETLNLKGELTKEDASKIHYYRNAKNVVIKDVKYDNCSSMFNDFDSLVQVEIDGLETTNTSDMFFFNSNLKNINIKNWDLSKVTKMMGMFSGCSSLESLSVENWDVSSVTNMYEMFSGCSALKNLPVGSWDVSKVTNMTGMFWGCQSLKSLAVENWDVSNVTSMSNMFCKCSALESLPVENWNVSKVTEMNYMFSGCSSLESVPIGRWDLSSLVDMKLMFDECTALKAIPVQNSKESLIEFFESNGYTVYQVKYPFGDSRISNNTAIAAKSEEDALGYAGQEEIDGYKLIKKSIKDNTVYLEYEKINNDVSIYEVILIMAAVLAMVLILVVWVDSNRSE